MTPQSWTIFLIHYVCVLFFSVLFIFALCVEIVNCLLMSIKVLLTLSANTVQDDVSKSGCSESHDQQETLTRNVSGFVVIKFN